jgi:hypothetical protein
MPYYTNVKTGYAFAKVITKGAKIASFHLKYCSRHGCLAW